MYLWFKIIGYIFAILFILAGIANIYNEDVTSIRFSDGICSLVSIADGIWIILAILSSV